MSLFLALLCGYGAKIALLCDRLAVLIRRSFVFSVQRNAHLTLFVDLANRNLAASLLQRWVCICRSELVF